MWPGWKGILGPLISRKIFYYNKNKIRIGQVAMIEGVGGKKGRGS